MRCSRRSGFSSALICWFWGLVRERGAQKTLAFGGPRGEPVLTRAFLGCPASGAMKNPARFPRRALLFKRALLYFPRIFNQGCIPPNLNIALLLRKCVSLLRS